MKTKRILMWVIGIFGAGIFALFLQSTNLKDISISQSMQLIIGVAFTLGMIVLVGLGYVLGRKIECSKMSG